MVQMSYSPGSSSRVPRGRIVMVPYEPGVMRVTWRSPTTTLDPPQEPLGISHQVGSTGSVAGLTVPPMVAAGARSRLVSMSHTLADLPSDTVSAVSSDSAGITETLRSLALPAM